MKRHAMVLLVVLLVIAIAAMVATTAAIVSMAPRTDVATAQRRTQSRMLAMAGVETVMAALSRQREDLLRGVALAPLPLQGVLFEDEQGDSVTRRGIWRIRSSKDGLGREQAVVLESAKLDLNHATAPMLVLAGLSSADATKVVSIRASRRIGSVAELAAHAITFDPARFTVFAADGAEPGLARAGGSGGDDESRVRLDRPWSSELEKQLKAVLSDDLCGHVQAIIAKGPGVMSDGALVNAAFARGLKPADIGILLQQCQTGGDATGIRLGRLDINHAPVEAIATIPGLTAETAAAIVARRATLDAALGSTPAWPLIEGVLDPESFAKAIDWIVTRSLVFEVTIEAGVLVDDRRIATQEPAFKDPVVLRAVIDLADPTPRLAELRDITRQARSPVPALPKREEPAETEAASAATGPPKLPPRPPLLDLEIPAPAAAPKPASAPPSRVPSATPSPPPRPPAPGRLGRWTTGD